MSFITKTEFSTHVYEENVDVITRGDDTKLNDAINAAISEASGYMSRYDHTTLFAATGTERDPILMMHVKDIAKWHFVNLCNASVDLELALSRYKLAIAWFDKVQSGKIVTEWPAAPTDQSPSTTWHIASNTKRGNYY